ncbi:MAG: protein TolQ [Pseudomonadota bacterium]
MEAVALNEVAGQDFSLMAMFLEADIVVKVVMLMLVLASVWSWAIALDKWMGVGSAKKKAKQFENAFWSGQPLDDMGDRVGDKASDAMARVFAAGAREWRDARRIKSPDAVQVGALVERARGQMGVAVSREATRMESGLGTLAIIGSASPFIGLFGTVWGIMNSFRSIAAAKETNLAVVAPGIAEALFATALGLAAAIPAVIFYNKFSGDIGKYTERMETFTEEFLVRLSRRITEKMED